MNLDSKYTTNIVAAGTYFDMYRYVFLFLCASGLADTSFRHIDRYYCIDLDIFLAWQCQEL